MPGESKNFDSIKQSHLKTPQGVERVFLEDSCRHRYLLQCIEDYFSSWGYLPTVTPVFDFYETYDPLLDRTLAERCYMFPDRDGEIIMLRSDITLFLARQLGQLHCVDPTRVYYGDSILRHQEEEDICNAEFFQAGAELLGVPGRNGDLEVILMLHDLLEILDLPGWKIHMGSRQLVNSILDSGSGEINTATAMNLLDIRDKESLTCLLAKNGVPNPEDLVNKLLFLGDPQEYKEIMKYWQNERIHNVIIGNALNDLSDLASDLCEISPEITKRLRIDLAEHGGQSYYTGFTVKVYAEGAAAAVVSGGRYDNLLGLFGTPRPAAGFSLLTRRIEQLSSYTNHWKKEFNPGRAIGKTFNQRYRDASARRRKGEKVALT